MKINSIKSKEYSKFKYTEHWNGENWIKGDGSYNSYKIHSVTHLMDDIYFVRITQYNEGYLLKGELV